ncbi:hypothetical protein JHK84_048054 [Glycine max]|nr:hypothetical protein JHK84_048054 [Glycine max]
MPSTSRRCHPSPELSLRLPNHRPLIPVAAAIRWKALSTSPPPPPLELLLALLAVLRPPSTVTKLVAALIWAKIWRSDERGTSDMKKMGQNIAKANERCRNGVLASANALSTPLSDFCSTAHLLCFAEVRPINSNDGGVRGGGVVGWEPCVTVVS